LRIVITNSSGNPIYEQVKEQIKSAIFSEELIEGAMLPSIRQLAKDLKISVITTTRAYNDLEQEGFITIVQGKGCYVSQKNSALVQEQLFRTIEEAFSTAVRTAKMAKMSNEELIHMLEIILEDTNYE